MPMARQPPSVVFPIRRSSALAAVLSVLVLLGVAAISWWTIAGAGTSIWQPLLAWAAWLLALVGGLHFWLTQPRGALHFDGQQWHVQVQRQGLSLHALSGPPEVLLDVQAHLWVGIAPAGRRRMWLWLERSHQPERWMDLRRAVYSRARPGADHAEETAPATAVGRES